LVLGIAFQGEGQHEEGKEKIAMTSPVTAEMGDEEYKVMLRFVCCADTASRQQTPFQHKTCLSRVAVGRRPAMVQDVVKLCAVNRIAFTCERLWILSLVGLQVAFVMPSKYTAQNIPKPKNAKVEIKPVEAHTLAALSFR
jgi:SOUL heme-binding protein